MKPSLKPSRLLLLCLPTLALAAAEPALPSLLRSSPPEARELDGSSGGPARQRHELATQAIRVARIRHRLRDGGVLVLFGAPGAGKGTQGAMLSRELGIPTISTGDLIRAHQKRTADASTAATLAGGGLSDSSFVLKLLEARLSEADCQNGFILDGFPRTADQELALRALLGRIGKRLDTVVVVDTPLDTIVRRLGDRRVCPHCNHVYNLASLPPQKAGVCDLDGHALIQRSDDRPEVIAERFITYQSTTLPVLASFDPGLITRVPDQGSPIGTFDGLIKSLERRSTER